MSLRLCSVKPVASCAMAAPSLHNAQFTLVRKGPHLRKPPPDFLMTDVCVYVCVYVCMYVFSQEIYGAYSLLSQLFCDIGYSS